MTLPGELLAGLGWPQLLAIWAVVVFAAVMRAFTGFGFALVAVPVFSLLMPATQAVVLSVSLALVVSLTTLKTYWGRYPVRSLAPLVALSLLGTGIGTAVLSTISLARFQLWVGLLVIAACAVLVFYRPVKPSPRKRLGAVVGLASGLMNGAFAIPGPPVIVYAMATEREPERSRALLMTFFLFSAMMALASYTVAGFVTFHSLLLFGLAYPAMFVGDRLGFWLFRRYGSGFYRRVALLVLFGVGLSISARALW